MALTKKQEHFAQMVAQGESQSSAYRIAFDNESSSAEQITKMASQLAHHEGVAERIRGLIESAQRVSVKAAAYTLDHAVAECDVAIALAINMGQSATIVAATKLKAQLTGQLVDKTKDMPAAALDEQDVSMIQAIRKELVARAAANAQAAELMGETSTDVLVSDSDRPVMRLPAPKTATA